MSDLPRAQHGMRQSRDNNRARLHSGSPWSIWTLLGAHAHKAESVPNVRAQPLTLSACTTNFPPGCLLQQANAVQSQWPESTCESHAKRQALLMQMRILAFSRLAVLLSLRLKPNLAAPQSSHQVSWPSRSGMHPGGGDCCMSRLNRLAACGTVRPLGALPDSFDSAARLPVVGRGSSAAVLSGQQHDAHPHKWFCWAESLEKASPADAQPKCLPSARLPVEHWLAAASGEAQRAAISWRILSCIWIGQRP